ncbi:MAG: hypothetical protein JWQ23_3966 [Herminiimonas sp.]|nr:hypothetical protein [Herminiimonas sp.]
MLLRIKPIRQIRRTAALRAAALLMLYPCVTALPLAAGLRDSVPVDAAQCRQMRARHVMAVDAPVRCDQLAIVRFSYVDFSGNDRHDGEIMVMAAVDGQVRDIFATLYRRRFPIAGARLMEVYQGDDAAAMDANNTSAFNHRPISGAISGLPSLHAYGLAIDLNPVQNPYIAFGEHGQASYSPAAGSAYANRLNDRPAKAPRAGMAEEVVQVFADHGFLIWGGYWDKPIDYQHFQVSRQIAKRLAALSLADGRTFFRRYVARYRLCVRARPARDHTSPGIACAAEDAE